MCVKLFIFKYMSEAYFLEIEHNKLYLLLFSPHFPAASAVVLNLPNAATL